MPRHTSRSSALILLLLLPQAGAVPAEVAAKVQKIHDSELCASPRTPDLFACAQAQSAVYEQYLNSSYSKLSAYLKAKKFTSASLKLLATQRQWIKFRQDDCNIFLETSGPDGSLGRLSVVYCLGDYAKTRADQLDALYSQFTLGK